MKPVVQAILVADQVYFDRETNKAIIAGVYRNISFRKIKPNESEGNSSEKGYIKKSVRSPSDIPKTMGSGMIFVSITGMHRDSTFEIRVVALRDFLVESRISFGLKSSNPLEVSELAFPLLFNPQSSGYYAVECLHADEPIGSFRLHVEEETESDKET